MGITTVERVRQLISAATLIEQRREIEHDRMGAHPVTTLSRPGFTDLLQLAYENPSVLISVFPSIESSAERLVVCEVLSEVSDPSTVWFWRRIIEDDVDQELIACAAIGLARQREVGLLEKLETDRAQVSSLRLLFHFGIARLLIEDPRGVDHLMELLRRELRRDPLTVAGASTDGPTMRFIALSILKQILPKGPGDEISQWPNWWDQRRSVYRRINSGVLSKGQLSYMPERSAFTTAPKPPQRQGT